MCNNRKLMSCEFNISLLLTKMYCENKQALKETQEKRITVVSMHDLGLGEGFATLPEQCKGIAKLCPVTPLLWRFLPSWGNYHPLETGKLALCPCFLIQVPVRITPPKDRNTFCLWTKGRR